MTRTVFASLQQDWARAAEEWLPVVDEESVWRFNRASHEDLPHQGWKLHVSATVLTARQVLKTIAPRIGTRGLVFKGPSTLTEVKRINCGLFYGYVQVGKIFTVYPRDDEEAAAVAAELHEITRGLHGPSVPFESRHAPGSAVYTRYGSFRAGSVEVTGPSGEPEPDRRDVNPTWSRPPPGLVLSPPPGRHPSPLSTSYRAYQALVQRGKGGVYRALDLSQVPTRHCLIKEGRGRGEVDWDGADGRDWVRHERDVLDDLATTLARPPQVRAFFETGGNAYLVLEMIDGPTLAELIGAETDAPTSATQLELAEACARAVAAVHEHGWVWRDAKPSNVIVSPAGVRLVDFEGAARLGDPVATPWGSTGYVPPEWLSGHTAAAEQDCYALGVILHQLFTRAASPPGAPDTLRRHRPDLDLELVRHLDALRSEDPGLRPAAHELADLLAAHKASSADLEDGRS